MDGNRFFKIIERCEKSQLESFSYKNNVEEINFSYQRPILPTPLAPYEDAAAVIPVSDANVLAPAVSDVNAFHSSSSEQSQEIKSNHIGIVSSLADIFNDPFVPVHISKGDTICTLEAMKLYNNIIAPVTGLVEELYVKAGDNIEYNQCICRIKVDI